VDGDHRDASDGRDLHHWIEQTLECMNGTASDISTSRCVVVWSVPIVYHLAAGHFA
jgi:hypothetical protein